MQELKAFVLAWRLAILKCGFMCFVTGATAWTTSTAGVSWSNLTPTEQFNVVLGCMVSMAGVVIAFLDRSIARIEQEKPPVG